jgi:hypothetical protein
MYKSKAKGYETFSKRRGAAMEHMVTQRIVPASGRGGWVLIFFWLYPPLVERLNLWNSW